MLPTTGRAPCVHSAKSVLARAVGGHLLACPSLDAFVEEVADTYGRRTQHVGR
jgi:hypothetical protein